MPGVLVVALWLATGVLATWLIGREELRRAASRSSTIREKVRQ